MAKQNVNVNNDPNDFRTYYSKIGREALPQQPDRKDKSDIKLEVKNLQISFRTQAGTVKAVRDISFDLKKGETFAIVGESGSGKSVTSKAIMGILAGNSIVEGGEILYDGKDLLKISEEDFHKIRGDKIAMIFQDPMSSLNPIMRVGQQLTEAMILKGKTSRKNARNDFNYLLHILVTNIHYANENNKEYKANDTNEKANIFDLFCIRALRLENIYNEAYAQASDLEFNITDTLFLVSKNQKVDLRKKISHYLKQIKLCYHPYILSSSQELEVIIAKLNTNRSAKKNMNVNEVIDAFKQLKEIVHQALMRKKPNFFTLGYYMMQNPEFNNFDMDIDELNKMTREYLDTKFMIDFIKLASKGVKYSHYVSIYFKKEALETAYELLGYLHSGNIDKKVVTSLAYELSEKVKQGIDRLEIHKNSTEYVFSSAINASIKRYFYGVKTNPIELKKYNKQKAKYDALVNEGKKVDWTLSPLVQVDLELALSNICKIVENLIYSLEHDIAHDGEFNVHDHVIEIIDFLKEQASRVVAKMNKKIAKAKAVKLLEEVGIPDPVIRFKQYPFEFSGGMRQRIVIAIALSANPDILICDEPTTALDVTIQSQILELINNIKKNRNLSVIFITHNLGVVANMADRIGVMYAGKIVEYGLSEEIFYEPRHPYTWALLSSMPDLHTKDKLESIPGTPPNMIYPPKGDAFAARNKYALEIDFEMQPPLFKITDTHYAATWLLHPDAPKVEMPKIIVERVERLKKQRELDELEGK